MPDPRPYGRIINTYLTADAERVLLAEVARRRGHGENQLGGASIKAVISEALVKAYGRRHLAAAT